MAESQDDDQVHWIDPTDRGVFPLDGFHISRSLRKSILNRPYRATFNTDFRGVVQACANRENTWINGPIFDLYMQLFQMGHAHSQEIWDGETLVGGVFGITLAGAFFGESMFSTQTDASKIALAWLIDRLRQGGFSLFDTQFITPHLASLGAIEISRADYLERLQGALQIQANIQCPDITQTAQDVIQRNTQTS